MPTDDGSPPDAPDQFIDPGADAEPVEPVIEATIVYETVETGAPSTQSGYTAAGVPTFEMVREKIETRFGTSIGATELASETPEGRRVEEQFEARQQAAAEKLAQIRQSMKTDDDH